MKKRTCQKCKKEKWARVDHLKICLLCRAKNEVREVKERLPKRYGK